MKTRNVGLWHFFGLLLLDARSPDEHPGWIHSLQSVLEMDQSPSSARPCTKPNWNGMGIDLGTSNEMDSSKAKSSQRIISTGLFLHGRENTEQETKSAPARR